jgi:hypothetical protein
MSITKKQVDVYKELSDMILKIIITIILIICFCIVLGFLLFSEPTWAKTAPLSVIESILGIAIRPLMKHFYPDKNKEE